MSSDWVAPRGGNQSNAQWGRNDLQEKFYKVRPSPPLDVSFPVDTRQRRRRSLHGHAARHVPSQRPSTSSHMYLDVCVHYPHPRPHFGLAVSTSLSIYLPSHLPHRPNASLSLLLLPLSPPRIPTLRLHALPPPSPSLPTTYPYPTRVTLAARVIQHARARQHKSRGCRTCPGRCT